MRTIQFTSVCILLFSCYIIAGIKDTTKKTFNSFTLALALPLSNTEAETIPLSNVKKLKPGWEAEWAFFGKPFTEKDNLISGLAFGGKISYSSWRRDSTLTPITFLGVQGITRFFTPPIIKPLDIFAQVGAGWFLGEYSFTDADTVDWSKPDFIPVVRNGQNCIGFHFGAGVDIDVVEILPLVTVVMTKKETCIWFTLNLGMTF